ncbi:putative transposase [Streptomyces sp. NBRC 110611]|nr:putative transposase [Streptomyces sp. NBRC 110611]
MPEPKRYPQGGGLTAERRAFRERIRMEAAGMFAAGQGNAVIAKEPGAVDHRADAAAPRMEPLEFRINRQG